MPDNYNILEPTSVPSGTTSRTVRALDVGSGQLAGAAVLVDTAGAVVPKAEDSAHTTADPGIPILGVVRATPLATSSTAGDYAMPTIDDRGRLYVRPNGYSQLYLTSAAPVPSGSDITNDSGGAIVGGDLAIRDASLHWLYIPFGVAGYTNCIVMIGTGWNNGLGGTAFNAASAVRGYTAIAVPGLAGQFLGTATISSGQTVALILGSHNGATIPYALNTAALTINTNNEWRYNVPEFGMPYPYIAMGLQVPTGSGATTGAFTMSITRW